MSDGFEMFEEKDSAKKKKIGIAVGVIVGLLLLLLLVHSHSGGSQNYFSNTTPDSKVGKSSAVVCDCCGATVSKLYNEQGSTVKYFYINGTKVTILYTYSGLNNTANIVRSFATGKTFLGVLISVKGVSPLNPQTQNFRNFIPKHIRIKILTPHLKIINQTMEIQSNIVFLDKIYFDINDNYTKTYIFNLNNSPTGNPLTFEVVVTCNNKTYVLGKVETYLR